MSHSGEKKNCTPRSSSGSSSRTVSLNVLPVSHAGNASGSGDQGKTTTRKASTMGKWRAGVLIAVHLAIIAHVTQWLIQGKTVSPVEPSETMYALEFGQINAGFIFFTLAIIATFVFGRFVCGWGCHVVALQDLCTHLMTKLGVRPKPFRTRLVLWTATLLGFYMFAAPTVRREIVWRAAKFSGNEALPWLVEKFWKAPLLADQFRAMRVELPLWAGQVVPFPGLKSDLIVEDFWATFPPWYVAIPFLLVCGFGVVYFLGSKGFCTYGCPYGAVFAPVDRVSIGRIVVNPNACEGCGHCTAVCTSNVRVHSEIKDFGMVVDPGCMKCLDCVSVCPNEALSFQFAKPAAFTATKKATTPTPKPTAKPSYDLTLVEELWVLLAAIVFFIGFRGMFHSVPLLMAAALGPMAAFTLWKLSRLLRDPNVRFQSLQLKMGKKITGTGWIFSLLAIAFVGMGAWGAVVNHWRFRADLADAKVTASTNTVLVRGYVPDPTQQALAREALAWYKLAGPQSTGGKGWVYAPKEDTRIAWLHLVNADLDSAEQALNRVVARVAPTEETAVTLARIQILRGKGNPAAREVMQRLVTQWPEAHDVRIALAEGDLRAGRIEDAKAAALTVLSDPKEASERAIARAAELLLQIGERDSVKIGLDKSLDHRPKSALLRTALSTYYLFIEQPEPAIRELRLAIDANLKDPGLRARLIEILRQMGKATEASKEDAALREMLQSSQPAARPKPR